MAKRIWVALLSVLFVIGACAVEESGPAPTALTQDDLQAKLDALQAAHPETPGFAIAFVLPDGAMVSAATGVAAPDGRAMTPDTPVRQASITKTFVAAALLRLQEEGKIDLDQPLGEVIDPEIDQLLTGDGYDTRAMTVRQVMMHNASLGDHFYGEAYLNAVLGDPGRVWTALDQLTLMVEIADPLGPPGEAMVYSDSGYVILGTIIERITGQRMGAAVAALLSFDAIGLETVWWDEETAPPAGTLPRAHQWLGDVDTFAFNGTIDAFGGGGIVASVEDIARFYAALFAGEVFDDPATLEEMTNPPGNVSTADYRLGLFPGTVGDHQAYGHSGFWGTQATAVPALGLVYAGVSLNGDGLPSLRAVGHGVAATLSDGAD
ncbi:MAG: serine hydrolase domain-containing protein [Pseudomonadota bacterium]